KQIQTETPNDPVSWSDHFHICGLKYRFRNYDQLFRCLDLLEAKIAAGGKRVPDTQIVQASAPVFIDWLRASAYAELGGPEVRLKWADSAWNAVPEGYRTVTAQITNNYFGRSQLKGFEATAAMLGSAGLGYESPEVTRMWGEGRNNPAALDLRPPVVSMSL